MATLTPEKNVWFHPATKREADVLAVKLFCLFAFILVGLITGGILQDSSSRSVRSLTR
jgi:hypothetical protein